MKNWKYNSLLLLVILAGLLASLFISVGRHGVEEGSRSIDLAIDYEGLQELAQREGLSEEEVLREAKEAGISSLAVYETTFKKLNVNGKATALSGAEILASYHSGGLSPELRALVEQGKIIGTEVYVVGHDARTYQEVKEDLFRRLGSERVEVLHAGSEEILACKAHYESFIKMNIGMPTDEMEAVNKAGFKVLARPSNYAACTEDDVEAVFKRLDGIEVSEVVFSGAEILGSPKELKTTAREMEERGLTLGLIEGVTQLQFYQQDGMQALAELLGYENVARLYAIPKDEQPKLKIDAAVERWLNTDEERNIRIDLLRIYDKSAPNMTLMETNMLYFKKTHDGLVDMGYTIGEAGSFGDYQVAPALRALVMAGVAAAGVLYLSLVIPALNKRKKWQYILFAVFALAAVVPVLMGAGGKIRVVAALASANLFPALAIIFMLDRVRNVSFPERIALPRLILTALGAIVVTSCFSFFGAAYLSGSLSDTMYFLEFNIFRGIKLTFVLPIVLVAVAFLQRFDVFDGKMDDCEGVAAQLKKILDMPIRVKTLVLFFVVLIAGVVFVARSGHTSGMPVSGAELKFRAYLEQLFYARPRTKELLIGHPAFMLAAAAFMRKWPTMLIFALVLVATIGQGSMVETFAHMRTPVFMSFARGLGGIAIGAVLGSVAIVFVEIFQALLSRAAKEKEKEQ